MNGVNESRARLIRVVLIVTHILLSWWSTNSSFASLIRAPCSCNLVFKVTADCIQVIATT